ncbi:MAG: rRNA cytosine-C5-methyltransferase [Bacteroidales bacterium]|nr:rRNA cytosine-C5-methyltransferase [Bacteroidales bacterium]
MECRVPKDFELLLHDSLPDYAADALLGSFGSSAAVSVRLNPLKPVSGFNVMDDAADPVPWCGDAFFLGQRKSFTLDPLFHAGAYYVQDSSSMFPYLLKDLISEAAKDGAVLDLCASPGGKSTHLISLLKDLRPLTVVNEAVGKRVPPLCDNIAKWGASNVIVTNSSASALGRMDGFFSVILADVPCSGEGMFRKSEDALSLWSIGAVKDCAALQRSIIGDIWPSLREGGLLVYSTCTYNHFENQDNVKYIAEHLGADFVPVDETALSSVKGLVKLPWGYQFVPGLVPGEGQFFAVLRKNSGSGRKVMRQARGRKARFVAAGEGGLVLDRVSGQVYMLPDGSPFDFGLAVEFANQMSEISPSCIRTLGCRVGEIKAGKIVPDADLALSNALAGAENGRFCVNSGVCGKEAALEFSSAEIDLETALKFLSRENITPQPSWPRGYILLKYRSLGLGFVNNLGNRCNSLHPLYRRILTKPR